MRRPRFVAILAAPALLLTLTGAVWAALIELGSATIAGDGTPYRLVYDEAQAITWLDYSRPQAAWYDQDPWAQGLEVVFNGWSLGDWRLPKAQPALGDDPGNEMDLLFKTLRDTYGGLDSGPFQHLIPDWYWSGTPYAGNPDYYAWAIESSNGWQSWLPKDNTLHALAVMDGHPVPLPSGLWLLSSGLLGLAGLGRRPRKQPGSTRYFSGAGPRKTNSRLGQDLPDFF